MWEARATETLPVTGGTEKAVTSHLDKLAGLHSLLEGAAHLVRREVEGRVGGGDALLDGLDGGSVPLLEGLDGVEYHLQDGGIGRATCLFCSGNARLLYCCDDQAPACALKNNFQWYSWPHQVARS